MKIAVITSIKAPYRTLQFEEICKNKNIDMNVYYTRNDKEDRDWEIRNSNAFKEINLKRIKVFDKFGTLNRNLNKIVKNNDIIVLGGYEKPTYILLSLLCRFHRKKYIIIYDGISCNRLHEKEKKLKWIIKNEVIKNSSAIWGNGTVSKRYFNEVFNYSLDKIYNQYLTIDGEKIREIGKEKIKIRSELRKKYGISENEKVIHYSGRLVEVKNIEVIIRALGYINNTNIILLITGDGKLKNEIESLSKKLGVKTVITGFINNQQELFKHYFISDIFVLPSIYEPWGLVVNEAMYAGLPVLVSEICGCSLDLVNENGYTFNPRDMYDLVDKINTMLSYNNLKIQGENSEKIIEEFSFYNSAKSFYRMLKSIK